MPKANGSVKIWYKWGIIYPIVINTAKYEDFGMYWGTGGEYGSVPEPDNFMYIYFLYPII